MVVGTRRLTAKWNDEEEEEEEEEEDVRSLFVVLLSAYRIAKYA